METKPNDDKQVAPSKGQADTPVAKADTGSDPLSEQKSDSTKNSEDKGQSDFDVQKEYTDLKKSYGEIRSEFTRRTQHEAELERKLAAVAEQNKQIAEKLAQAVAAPFNSEQFMEDFKTHGPKALDPYYDARDKRIQDQNDKIFQELTAKNVKLETKFEATARRGDSQNYPDFQALEPTMQEIAMRQDCPVDLNKPIPDVLDALYKLAKEEHSADAVKAAAKDGRQKAEADLAKESATAVAGGGKAPTTAETADLENMPMDKLEKLIVDKYGVAER